MNVSLTCSLNTLTLTLTFSPWSVTVVTARYGQSQSQSGQRTSRTHECGFSTSFFLHKNASLRLCGRTGRQYKCSVIFQLMFRFYIFTISNFRCYANNAKIAVSLPCYYGTKYKQIVMCRIWTESAIHSETAQISILHGISTYVNSLFHQHLCLGVRL